MIDRKEHSMPRKKKFQTSLPSIPCTEEMRNAVVAVADRNNLNLVDVIRQSISLFLSENDTKSINQETKSILEQLA
jgi:hypothetical protein